MFVLYQYIEERWKSIELQMAFGNSKQTEMEVACLIRDTYKKKLQDENKFLLVYGDQGYYAFGKTLNRYVAKAEIHEQISTRLNEVFACN